MKSIIIGVVTTSNNYENILKINYKIYKKILNKFNKFYIINLENLVFFKQKAKISPKILNKNIKIFKPNNALEFIKFFKEKKLIAFNCLGKNISNFKIYYLLNEINIIQILLMNIGYLSNQVEIGNNIKNFKSNMQFFLKKKITNLIFRILTIINVFPKIDYYFEASKPIVDNINRSVIKKIEKKFNFLRISYFRNVLTINSRAYDNLNTKNKLKKNDYIVFVDSFFEHPDRILREGKILELTSVEYYKKLDKIFTLLSLIYKKQIIICVHPKNNNPLFYKYLSKFKIIKYKTQKMIEKSFITLFHESSAVLDAVLLKKNIINLKSELLGHYLLKRCDMYSRALNLFSIDLDSDLRLNKNNLNVHMNNSKKKYEHYIKNYLNSDNKVFGYNKIISKLEELNI
jgi:hypothetical protein